MRGRAKVYLKFVGANLHRLRLKADLRQDDVAQLTGLDVRFLRRVERGTVNLRFDTFIRLAEALKVEPGVLLRAAKPKPPKVGRPRKRGPSHTT
jgi:transcriptional regulator with XRE-family HTH domain